MAHGIVILLSLCAALTGIESMFTSVHECCEAGRVIALRKQDCTALPRFSSHICSIAQEHCCRALARKRACDTGIKVARGHAVCERSLFTGSNWEAQISQSCCDCCTLGLKTDSMGFSCDFQDLQLDKQCSNAAKVCCQKPKDITPSAKGQEELKVLISRPPDEPNTCRELNCSQLCVGNGRCVCNDGFRLQRDGVTCEDINECLADRHNCSAEQVCVNTDGSFHCQLSCHPGFTITDDIVCKDINECKYYSWRLCGHICENTEGSYRCRCISGFRLAPDGRTCEDINECLTGRHNCPRGQVCLNTEGSFHCQREIACNTGYKLTGSFCQDIDECALGRHDCGANCVCVNTAGSFRCEQKLVCGDGFTLDAAGGCTDVDECSAHTSPCQPSQTCVNTVGSYSCHANAITCPRGFHLSVNGTRCEDVNECRVGNKCAKHVCVNLEGLYRCECRSGYMFNSVTKLCEDINECTHYPGRLCAHKCENTEGSYRCSCATGFKLAYDGRDCEDINECEDKPCSQECTNVYGSYQCYCHRGYQLNDVDGMTCEDIDECMLPNVCSYQCVNTPGDFNCTCPSSGYTLLYDGRTCQDIDECAAGTHSCSAKETCFNVQGGFRCLFFECPPNFSRAGKGSAGNASAVVRCVKACQESDGDCARDPVHIITSTALSLPTSQRLEEPEEIVLLRTSAEAKQDLLPDEPDVVFDILETDELLSFDVIKGAQNGMVVGVIRQIKPVLGPKELILEVTMKYVQSGVVSQQNIVLIHVFISEFWF
ncbi:PREDICTED: fibulin-1 isoform X4 [Poecilia mexicana]|uniref:fibulin-1 isoform X4 n=1 Tax=Poecilia mexicana TaxID=48701 RepID=UPI00072E1497|nr:PREDICTED: fibulin-1 isoform X4 [Poecilia mexicana]